MGKYVKGAGNHSKRVRRMSSQQMVDTVGKALVVAGGIIEVDAEISITAGSISGKGHVPSLPGQPPSADSRQLDGSIETTHPAPLRVEVVARAPHALPLELGTSKMAARPFMHPAAARNRDEVSQLVAKAVSKVMAAGGNGKPQG